MGDLCYKKKMLDVSQEMREKYLIRKQEEILFLREALHKGQVEIFHQSGHKIFGSAESFGFPELLVFASEMENLRVKDFATQAQQLIKDFSICVESLIKQSQT